MKRMRIALPGLLLMGAVGCSGEAPNDAHTANGPTAVEQINDFGITLDDGKKWQVDEHTRASAGRLTKLVRDAGAVDSTESARALAEELDAELSTLIQGCTMTGPAHDQLHVFLMQLFPRVEQLEEESDPQRLAAVGEEIGALFDAYQARFE